MGAIGEPEMNYAHQVRSLSTKEGGGARSVLKSRVGPPGQGCILIRSRDIGWIDALDLFWVPIGTMGALGKPKMKYMHQVRSLSTKRRATIAPMGATGEPEMNYAHQVRSLSTKKGGRGQIRVAITCWAPGAGMYINKE